MRMNFKSNCHQFILVGFCLGGQIAGNVEYNLKRIYNGKTVGAIWGDF